MTKKSNSHKTPIIYDYEMPRESVDLDALSIVRRLDRSDYLAYFVGGAVRDSLLGVTPKDFDIATSARPRDVRKVFKNCRLIGKRFTLAHVYFAHEKIIEVATFRTKPSVEEQEDGLIISDNEFGTAESDAERRDFTINALYYDPLRHEIIDYCGGMEDVYRRVLRTIGEPVVRFREDPIRMLRAVKFAARLELSFEPSLESALRSERLELLKAARPRFAQELLRFLQGGAARRSYELLQELDYLSLIVPELNAAWTQHPNVREQSLALLGALDELNTEELSDESALIALLWWPTFSQLTAELHASPKQLKWISVRLLAPLFARVRLSLKHLYATSRVLAELSMMSQEASVPQGALMPHNVDERQPKKSPRGGVKKGQTKKSKLSAEAAVIYALWREVTSPSA